MSDTYKPTGSSASTLSSHLLLYLKQIKAGTDLVTEHGGLKEDGTPDKRIGTGQFAQGKVDPTEAGAQGGKASGGSGVDTSENTGSSGGNGRKCHLFIFSA